MVLVDITAAVLEASAATTAHEVSNQVLFRKYIGHSSIFSPVQSGGERRLV